MCFALQLQEATDSSRVLFIQKQILRMIIIQLCLHCVIQTVQIYRLCTIYSLFRPFGCVLIACTCFFVQAVSMHMTIQRCQTNDNWHVLQFQNLLCFY